VVSGRKCCGQAKEEVVAKKPKECKRCRGLGRLPCRLCIAYGGVNDKCPKCGGRQWVVCDSCDGKGKVK
jgi:hypothetical protein